MHSVAFNSRGRPFLEFQQDARYSGRHVRPHARIQGLLISALAHHRQGVAATAQARLASALEMRSQLPLPKLPDGSLNERLLVTESTSWWDVLAVEQLHREAAALLASGAKSPHTTSASADPK